VTKKKKDDKEEKRTVWIACRAARPCGGQTAIVTRTWKRGAGDLRPGPSRTTRYKCTKCGGSFSVSV